MQGRGLKLLVFNDKYNGILSPLMQGRGLKLVKA